MPFVLCLRCQAIFGQRHSCRQTQWGPENNTQGAVCLSVCGGAAAVRGTIENVCLFLLHSTSCYLSMMLLHKVPPDCTWLWLWAKSKKTHTVHTQGCMHTLICTPPPTPPNTHTRTVESINAALASKYIFLSLDVFVTKRTHFHTSLQISTTSPECLKLW